MQHHSVSNTANPLGTVAGVLLAGVFIAIAPASAEDNSRQTQQRTKPLRDEDLPYPPELPGGKAFVTDQSPKLLEPPESLRPGVRVAKTPPTIDFMFYPEQNYPGKPWSNWGDGSVAGQMFYSAIGDHLAIGRGDQRGNGAAMVYQYNPNSKTLVSLVNTASLLNLPKNHYAPGKIHSRVDMGSDGWLYYATHRGSPKAAVDANHYEGDWILRTNPSTGQSEIVANAPVAKHSIPNSLLDSQRMIFYGGTAAGPDASLSEIQFFAYDLKQRKLLYRGPDGPARCMFLAASTGRLYYVPGNADGPLMRYDPSANGPPEPTGQVMGIRAATTETDDRLVYTVSTGQRSGDATLWQFNTRSEKAKAIGSIAVGTQAYVASLDVDPSGQYLYYVPGAHGGGPRDGSPLVQFHIKTGTKKVIAFFAPYYQEKYGFTPKGTYCTAVSQDGTNVFITWNVSRGTRAWDCCGLAVVQIPASEREVSSK